MALFACAAIALTSATQVQAADKVDGTWTWTQQARGGGGGGGGQARTTTLTLKSDGEKLTGKISSPGRGGGAATETEISNGKISGSDVSFSVTRTMGQNTVTVKYSGKLDGDTIKGEMEMPGRNGGDPTKRPWEAKRSK